MAGVAEHAGTIGIGDAETQLFQLVGPPPHRYNVDAGSYELACERSSDACPGPSDHRPPCGHAAAHAAHRAEMQLLAPLVPTPVTTANLTCGGADA